MFGGLVIYSLLQILSEKSMDFGLCWRHGSRQIGKVFLFKKTYCQNFV